MRTSSFGAAADGELGRFETDGWPYEAVPPVHVKAFPEWLRAAGYYTLNRTKTDYQFGEPFTLWDASGADAHWRHRAPGQPFFAMISSFHTHESGMFRPGFAGKTPGQAERGEQNIRRLSAALPERTDPSSVTVPGYLPDTPEVRRDLAQHYDNIRLMDADVGALLAELAADGLLDETVVIWTTDHGDGLPRAKRSLYDSGLHVPLVVRFPDGRRAGSTDDQLVSFVDLAPTLLTLASAPVPEDLPGRDFLGDSSPREWVFAARDRIDEIPDRSRAVRDSRYKYIRNHLPERPFFMPVYYRENLASMAELRRLREAGTLAPVLAALFEAPRPAEELYDLDNDPWELQNLAGQAAMNTVQSRLRDVLVAWEAGLGPWQDMPERQMVDEWMWPGGQQPLTDCPVIDIQDGASGRLARLQSKTTGASMGYRVNGGHWMLYAGPVPVATGDWFEARAVRYGFRASDVVASEVR